MCVCDVLVSVASGPDSGQEDGADVAAEQQECHSAELGHRPLL